MRMQFLQLNSGAYHALGHAHPCRNRCSIFNPFNNVGAKIGRVTKLAISYRLLCAS